MKTEKLPKLERGEKLDFTKDEENYLLV